MRIIPKDKICSIEKVFKKSQFITYISYLGSKNELDTFLQKYKNSGATHNCFAYSVYTENQINYGYSNDGEPAQTSGDVLLNFLKQNELVNIVILVVRKFGGAKLGKGPLLRAYLSGTTEIIKSIQLKQFIKNKIIIWYFSLSNITIIENFIKNNELEIISKKISFEECFFEVNIPKDLDIKNISHYLLKIKE